MASTYLSPGVYIEEVPAGPKPIQGVPTGVLAIVGKAERGPLLQPVRISGWGEFQARFGGKLPDSFTADAVWGFFENGGGAVYVVRCDDSSASTWELFDANGDAVVTVEAESPGRWANNLVLVAGPQRGGASGRQFFSRLTGVGDLVLGNGDSATVTVDSSVGVQPGDTMRLRAVDGTETIVDVTGISGNEVTIQRDQGGASKTFPRPDTVLLAAVPGDATRLNLLVGSGFRTGDILEAEIPGGDRHDVRVASAEAADQGMHLDLDDDFGQLIPGAAFAQRRIRVGVRFRVGSGGTGAPGAQLEPDMEDVLTGFASGDRLLAWGMEAAWDSASEVFAFESAVRDGRGQVDVGLRVRSVERTLSIPGGDATAARAALMERFGYLPAGTVLTLTTDASNDFQATRSGDSFTFAGGSSAPGTETYVRAAIAVPDSLSGGVVLACPRTPEVGDYVDFGGGDLVRITAVEGLGAAGVYAVTFADDAGADPGEGDWQLLAWQPTRFQSLRFSVTVRDTSWAPLEAYEELSLDSRHRSYIARDGVVNQASALIRVRPLAGNVTPSAARTPVGARRTASGTLGDASLQRFRDGFEQLEKVTEPDLLACPDALGFSDERTLQAAVFDAMIGHAEQHMRFAIVDAPDIRDEQALADWRLESISSTHAAVYGPHLRMVNLDPGGTDRYLHVPPSGFVAGVCARTDRDRGVFKAPANERVRGVVGLARDFTERQQDLLNPKGVNLVRAFRGRGIRVWGARNATDDTQWRYVPVRRLFNYLERSTREGTEWVVFEPNDARTWLRVRVSLENFLNGVWRAGGLFGNVPEEAYQVRVGLGETMTHTQIDLGLLIVEVAVAPVKPAEFVVFRFSHKVQTES